jgi:hypothetical protein
LSQRHACAFGREYPIRFRAIHTFINGGTQQVIQKSLVRAGEEIETVLAEIDRILAGDVFMPQDEPDDPPSRPDPRHFFDS